MVGLSTEGKFVHRIFFHKEETEFGKGPIQPSYVPFLGCRTHTQDIIRDEKARTDSQKGPSNMWCMLPMTKSFTSSSSDPTSTSLSQSGLSGHPYRHTFPNRGTSFRSMSRRYRRRAQSPPKVLLSWHTCASTVWPPDNAISASLDEVISLESLGSSNVSS